MFFHFTAQSQGRYAGTLDSPDQGAFGIPTDTVIVQGGTIQVMMNAIAGQFKGTRAVGIDSIVGTWTQGGKEFLLVLELVKGEPEKNQNDPRSQRSRILTKRKK